MMKYKKGFTLLELLVVIAVIGIFSGIVIATLNNVRSKSRDARRKSDFRQISTALELYYDEYGGYPATGSIDAFGRFSETGIKGGYFANTNPNYDNIESKALDRWNGLFNPLVDNKFMSDVPRDPVNVPSGYYPWNYGGGVLLGESVNRLYHYRSNGTPRTADKISYDANHYLLCTWLESESDTATLGYNDMQDPFDPSKLLHKDDGYSIHNYCVGQ